MEMNYNMKTKKKHNQEILVLLRLRNTDRTILGSLSKWLPKFEHPIKKGFKYWYTVSCCVCGKKCRIQVQGDRVIPTR